MNLQRVAGLFSVLLFAGLAGYAQQSGLRTPPLLNREEGERAARALVADLLSRKPEKISTTMGTLRIRSGDRKEREVPVRFEIVPGPTNWISRYEVLSSNIDQKPVKLTIIHPDGQPNEYWIEEEGRAARRLSREEIFKPFASSDFWIGDLGMEFLHWPGQRVLKKELRRSMSCNVLESTNSGSPESGYSRVVSWIEPETGAIVHADAYDPRGELLKRFDPSEIAKVNGVRQLEEMEIRNPKTSSRTWIRFNLQSD